MIDEHEEYEEHDGYSLGNVGYRRHTYDKLNWKLEIQKRLDICLSTYRTDAFGKNVERVIKAVYFDVRGYRFRKQIDEKKEELLKNKLEIIDYYRNDKPEIWGHPIHQASIKYDLTEIYYDALFDFVFQLVSEKGLLVDTDVYVPIRMKKGRFGENGGTEPVTSPYE